MIDSVLNQSFHDFEIIIVNDGSTDDTQTILERLCHSRIRVIQSEHKGPSHARNLAIKNARASIILNLDADDKISPDLLKKAYHILCDNPGTGIVYSECEFFGSRHGRMRVAGFSLRKMLAQNRIVSNAFFRKEDWQIVGGYSEDFIYGLEDWDLWLSIIGLGRKVFKIRDSNVSYRRYDDPFISRSGYLYSDRMKVLNSLSLIFKRHENMYSLYPRLFKRFSAYQEMITNETHFVRWGKNNNFILKRKLSNLIN